MLDWKTLDPDAVYPNWQLEATGEKYRFRAVPQHDGWWHLLITKDDAYVISLNCRGLARVKDTAQNFEVFKAETVGGAR
jgi:hypothetical protein